MMDGALPICGVVLSRGALLGMALLACLVFTIDAGVALRMRASGALFLGDIFFDADPFRQIGQLAYAMPVPGAIIPTLPNDVHPLVPYMAVVFLQAGARIWSYASGEGARIIPYLRETLTLLISPTCLALSVFIFGRMLARLGFGNVVALAGAAILGFSYSSLIFGAMPEHFAMSMLAIVALMAWAASWLLTFRAVSRQGYLLWALISAYAIGTTVTNGVAAFALLAVVEMRHGAPMQAIARAAGLAVAVGLGVMATGFLLVNTQVTLGGYEVAPSGVTFLGDFSTYEGASIVDRLSRLLSDSLQAICAMDFDRVGPLHAWTATGHPDVIVPARPADLSLFAMAILALILGAIVFGATVGLRSAPAVRALTLAGLAVLAQTIAMHSVFGTVMMLYTQHFLAILVFFLVLALNALAVPRGGRGIAILGVIVVLLAVNNATLDVSHAGPGRSDRRRPQIQERLSSRPCAWVPADSPAAPRSSPPHPSPPPAFPPASPGCRGRAHRGP